MGARDRIRAEDGLESGDSERRLEGLEGAGHGRAHLVKAFLGIAANADVSICIVEVVLEDQMDVGVVERAVLGHQLERLPVEQRAIKAATFSFAKWGWVREAGAADGFIISAAYLPGAYEEFVDQVVPLLQDRGVFRTEYEGTTLREHLGLSRPTGEGSE